MDKSTDKARAIGGWLYLIGFGIIISPFKIGFELLSTTAVFQNENWELITSAGSEFYNPLLAFVIMNEIVINIALIVVWMYLGILFFKKRNSFPKWYMGTVIFTLIYMLTDYGLVKLALPQTPMLTFSNFRVFMPAILSVLIWVPYIRQSERVKATFIR